MSILAMLMQSSNVTVATTPAAPSNTGVYDYSGGTRFGISWTINESGASHELFRDGSLFATVGIGVSTYDVGLKSGDGTHTWKVRANNRGAVSVSFSDEITTGDGVLA